jgi:hypothetical protein
MFSRNGNMLYVASSDTPRIAVVDPWSGEPLGQIVLQGQDTCGIVGLRAAGELGFALHGASGAISVFHLRSRDVSASLELPGPSVAAFPTSTGQAILVPNERDHSSR